VSKRYARQIVLADVGAEGQAKFGRVALSPGLDAEIVFRASESGEPVEGRHRPALGCRRQEDGEAHRASAGGRRVLVDEMAALEAARLADSFDGRLGHF